MNRTYLKVLVFSILIPIIVAIIITQCVIRSAQAEASEDLIVLYDFTETSGAIIHDRIPIVPSLDLTIADPTNVEWLNPGLRVKGATVAKASNARTKLMFSNGITIEAWLKPVNNTQGGPARVITFSADSGNRNFTFGQQADYWNQRFRTSENPGNGTHPSLNTPATSIHSTPALQHVVYTRSEAGTAAFYIDGLKVQAVDVPGDLSNWVSSYGFGMFNEINFPIDTRTWLGDIFKVAIYGTVLTEAQIVENFNTGVPIRPPLDTGTVSLAWDANIEEDLEGYKIYYGRLSRFETVGAIQAWCTAQEPTKETCADEWKAICKEDPACHSVLFQYEEVIDVKKVTEYTLTDLIPGVTYSLAATAYDTAENESNFSIELTHFVAVETPASPEKLIFEIPVEELSDSIKGPTIKHEEEK